MANSMTETLATASFRAVPISGYWQVEVTWSDGLVQLLSGYQSEDEAKSWIAFYRDQWIEIAATENSSKRRSGL